MATDLVDDLPGASELQPREFPKRDYHFWMVFLALGVGNALGALEMSAVSNALPTIVHSLGGEATFIWVGAAYGLCQTILVPFGGGLAEIFGRRPVMLASMLIMSVGSAVCGSAKNMQVLIAGRVIQGLGAGGIGALTPIIVADLVPLNELGSFGGLINVSWAIFTGIGPVIAGGLAQSGQWRWLFYLNIPIAGAAALLIFLFLRVPTPSGSVRGKLVKVDWTGNLILVGATTATLLGATWGGSPYPWSSYRVLVPLIIGIAGLVAFFVYEAKLATYPVVPFALMNNRTSISGFLQGFVFPMILTALLYFAPVYLQACKGTSPTTVGAEMLSIVLVVAPSAIAAGISIQVTGRYRPQIWFAWVMLVLSTGLLTSVHANTSLAPMLIYLVLGSLGAGTMITCSWFPVIAPLDISQTTLALAFTTFVRNFAGIWGITIGGAVLQNGLQSRISNDLLASLPGGAAAASAGSGAWQYSLIPLIPSLAEPARGELQTAFGGALQDVWRAYAVIAALGLLASLAMKSFVLETAQKPPAQDTEVVQQEKVSHSE